MFCFSEIIKKSSSTVFQEILILEVLKTVDLSEEICSISKNSCCRDYLKSVFEIVLPNILHDEELKEKLEEFDCLIKIYNEEET